MISYILLLIVVITLGFIGALVFLSNRRSTTNQYFFLFTLFVIAWILANYLENSSTLLLYGDILLRIDFASAALLAVFFYLFCRSFLIEKKIDAKKRYLGYFLATIFATISFSDLIIKDISFVENTIQFQKGSLFYLYTLSMFSFFAAGFWNLIDKYNKTTEKLQKLQATYILIGFLISISIASTLNLILPQFFFVSVEISRIGIYSILAFCMLAGYSILKHHLFNIKVIATEIFTFTIWILLLARTLMAETWQERIIDGSLLALVVFFGILLIKGVIKEVEQREKLEKITVELEAANERLRQLDEAKSEFLSIASHQLRTPMTSIKGILSMLLEEFWGPLNADQKKYLLQVSQSGERLLSLIEELLDISRIEAGKIKFDFQPVNLFSLTEKIIKNMEPQAKDKKLSLDLIQPPAPLPDALCDPAKIEQVIENLIDNSIKYSDEGGSIIELKKQDGFVIFSITDEGIGISKKQLSQLFTKFQRGQMATNQHTEGAGLGLYWADKVIQAHNGKIWAESEGENKGSIFYFTLPLA